MNKTERVTSQHDGQSMEGEKRTRYPLMNNTHPIMVGSLEIADVLKQMQGGKKRGKKQVAFITWDPLGGKTTLSYEMAQYLGADVFHLEDGIQQSGQERSEIARVIREEKMKQFIGATNFDEARLDRALALFWKEAEIGSQMMLENALKSNNGQNILVSPARRGKLLNRVTGEVDKNDGVSALIELQRNPDIDLHVIALIADQKFTEYHYKRRVAQASYTEATGHVIDYLHDEYSSEFYENHPKPSVAERVPPRNIPLDQVTILADPKLIAETEESVNYRTLSFYDAVNIYVMTFGIYFDQLAILANPWNNELVNYKDELEKKRKDKTRSTP